MGDTMARRRKPSRFDYDFGYFVSRGTGAFAIVLLIITLLAIVVSTVLLTIVHGASSIGLNIRDAIVYTLSPDNLYTADYAGPVDFIALLIVALCGLLVTSALVALIVTWVQSRLESLRMGRATIVEEGHYVILGYNENTFVIVRKLAMACDRARRACIVIAGNHDKIEMEQAVRARVEHGSNIRLVFRSGEITDDYLYMKCSIDTARTIVIDADDDALTVKAILGVTHYLKDHGADDPSRRICASLDDYENYTAALAAGNQMVDLLYVKQCVSRIIAQTCHQIGLAAIYRELFSFAGSEIYFESYPQLAGRSFGDTLSLFSNGVALGIRRGDDLLLNPGWDTTLQKDDRLVLLEEDEGTAKPNLAVAPEQIDIRETRPRMFRSVDRMLVLGYNDMLADILEVFDGYTDGPISVTIISQIAPDEFCDGMTFSNITVELRRGDPRRRSELQYAVDGHFDHVLILSDYSREPEEADATMLLQLIHMRALNATCEKRFKITSEMRNTRNEKLASVSDIDDFVIGSNLICLMLSHVASDRVTSELFDELLSPRGCELAVVSASEYFAESVEADFHSISRTVAGWDEIALGYEKLEDGRYTVRLNPDKSARVTLTDKDYVIVLTRGAQAERS